MNFKYQFEEGQKGKNVGRTTGLPQLDKAIRGIQRKMIYGIASGPKVGKTKLVNYSFLISPYEEALANGTINDLEWIYYSFEIDRVKMEFEIAALYMARRFGIFNFRHTDGEIYTMCSDYLMGKILDKNSQPIMVSPDHTEMVKEIYIKRILPLFGEYDIHGRRLTKGKIDFIEEKENPTGIRNYLLRYAKNHGDFISESYKTFNDQNQETHRTRIVGYKPHNPNKMLIIITDHLRKCKIERGFSLKQNVDKLVEYQVELRNWCHYTFVDVIHLNREMANIDRLRYAAEYLYPTGEDVKDTGNLSEEANVMMTMMNPGDQKYNLKTHFGLEVESYPNYRSIHIVESRDTECPRHIQTNMFGGPGIFHPITI